MTENHNPHRIEEGRFFTGFDDTEEALTELLRRMGLLEFIEAIKDPAERARVKAEIINSLRPVLEDIKELPINKPEGQVKFLIKNKHFNLRKLVFSTLELGGSVLALIVIPPMVPLGAVVAGVAISPAVISIIGKLKEIVHSLTPEELVVYNAIAGVMVDKGKKVLTEKDGACEEEIKGFFLKRKEAPLKLEAILKSLEAKHVIEPFAGGDGQTTYYRLVR
jgi:hypothetical protein